MADPTHFEVLFGHHFHSILHLLECAGRVNEVDYGRNPGYGHGSVHALLYHLLRTDHNWRMILETGRQVAPLPAEDYPTRAALQAGFTEEQAAWEVLLAQLSVEQADASIQATNWRGETFPMDRWRILQHVVLHGMQHFAELGQLLSAYGQSPGDIDFIFYE